MCTHTHTHTLANHRTLKFPADPVAFGDSGRLPRRASPPHHPRGVESGTLHSGRGAISARAAARAADEQRQATTMWRSGKTGSDSKHQDTYAILRPTSCAARCGTPGPIGIVSLVLYLVSRKSLPRGILGRSRAWSGGRGKLEWIGGLVPDNGGEVQPTSTA